MDGVHDLGGMQGFGPVEREASEPVFHARWEAEVLAIMRAGGSRGLYNIDEFRHGIERMDPAEYLRASYYEKWLDGITRLLVEKGVVSEADLEARAEFFRARPDASARETAKGPLPAGARASWDWLQNSRRDAPVTPRFKPGDPVRTREMHPHGHTRLPRYARGRRGVIHCVHGIHVFPDSNAHGQGEQPQPLYSVRFQARELWGDSAEPNEQVHLDCWESYLLPGR
jgi:nitrile hydratase beta subunit